VWIAVDHLVTPVKNIPENLADLDSNLRPSIARELKINAIDVLEYKIIRKTIDARKKNNLHFIFNLRVRLADSLHQKFTEAPPEKKHGMDEIATKKSLPQNPIVVGSGPAGLMAAYLLAEYGCNPIVIERGREVNKRHDDIDDFHKTRQLDPESNYLFGEGGAGTYSDGKLYTGLKDNRIKYILETFAAAGAPKQILYLKRPHIGSDILPEMVKNIRMQIRSMGGTFLWNSRVDQIMLKDGKCKGVILANGEKLEAPLTILAHGLSARDLTAKLIGDMDFKLKDFQIGCRIEHSQSFVNQIQYGMDPLPAFLDPAEYNFTSRPQGNRNIAQATTFCMCPGGEIIPATNIEGQLSTNGMSRFAREGIFANASIIVNQKAENFSSPDHAFEFINSLEKKAYEAGGGNYACPAQGAYAFVRGEEGLPIFESSYRFGLKSDRIDEMLPQKTTEAIREALAHFEKLAPGFMTSGTIVGIETHVSSPVRFLRNPETLESSAKNLYIVGEGAGCAGGIISSALDGLKIAQGILTETSLN